MCNSQFLLTVLEFLSLFCWVNCMECRDYPKNQIYALAEACEFSRTHQLPPTVQRHACEINFFHLSLVSKIIHVQQATYPWLYSVFFGCSSKGSDWIICCHFALLLAPSCHINPMQVPFTTSVVCLFPSAWQLHINHTLFTKSTISPPPFAHIQTLSALFLQLCLQTELSLWH